MLANKATTTDINNTASISLRNIQGSMKLTKFVTIPPLQPFISVA